VSGLGLLGTAKRAALSNTSPLLTDSAFVGVFDLLSNIELESNRDAASDFFVVSFGLKSESSKRDSFLGCGLGLSFNLGEELSEPKSSKREDVGLEASGLGDSFAITGWGDLVAL